MYSNNCLGSKVWRRILVVPLPLKKECLGDRKAVPHLFLPMLHRGLDSKVMIMINALCAEDCGKCSTHITWLNPHNKFRRKVLLLSLPVYRWQIWGSEKSIKLVQSHTWNKGQNWNLNWGHFHCKAITLYRDRWETILLSLQHRVVPFLHPLFRRKNKPVSRLTNMMVRKPIGAWHLNQCWNLK